MNVENAELDPYGEVGLQDTSPAPYIVSLNSTSKGAQMQAGYEWMISGLASYIMLTGTFTREE